MQPTDPQKTSKDQITRANRAPAALDTAYFRLDERPLHDLIHTATELARHLTYFDERNRAHRPDPASKTPGAWATFFHYDITFLLAEMAAVDVSREYRTSQIDGMDLHALVIAHSRRLMDWYLRARELAVLRPDHSIEAVLFNTLSQPPLNELKRLFPEHLTVEILADAEAEMQSWIEPSVPPHYSLDTIFSTVNAVTARVVDAAKTYLERSLRNKPDHEAHLGLFLAFVQLFQRSQIELNQITERHLEFYFGKVLRTRPRAAQNDHTYVTFEPAPGARPERIGQGTQLVAGSASGPNAIIYETDRAVEVTQTRTRAFMAMAVDRDFAHRDARGVPFVTRVAVYPVANSADGKGAPLDDPKRGWSPFGPGLRAPPTLGIALAGPILSLAGGNRRICLTLRFDPQSGTQLAEALMQYRQALARHYEGELTDARFVAFLADAFEVSLTTAGGFTNAHGLTVELSEDKPDTLVFQANLPSTAPPVAPHSGFHPYPALRLTLNAGARALAFTPFRNTVLSDVTIEVSVTGLTDLKLITDAGPVAPKKPFVPFGPLAKPGSRLTVRADELGGKRVQSLDLRFDWIGLPVPPADLAGYYADYDADIGNLGFRATLSAGNGASWVPLQVSGPGDTQPGLDASLFTSGRSVTEWQVPVIDRQAPDPEATEHIGSVAPKSDLRIEFAKPNIGFGDELYPRLIAEAALRNARSTITKAVAAVLPKPKGKTKKAGAPNPPLRPQVAAVALSYTARASLRVGEANQPIELFNLRSLGDASQARDGRLFPETLNHDGYLMIGLDRVDPPEHLTLFFQIRDSQAASWTPEDGTPRPETRWTYLGASGWQPLPASSVLSDSTQGLTTHGVIELSMPMDLMETTQFSDDPLCWLAIALRGDRARYGRVVAITAQAVKVARASSLVTGSAAPPQLPAGQIKRFLRARKSIAKILQPIATEGGTAREAKAMQRIRISERIGHRMRALRPADHARMVLEAFPHIADAKCWHGPAGQVQLIVTPVRSRAHRRRYPRVSLYIREQIARWLEDRMALGAGQVHVSNPEYEEIRVQAYLGTAPQSTPINRADVEDHITRLIAPWMLDPALPVPIGHGALDVASVTASLQALPSIGTVHGVSLLHRFGTGPYGLKDSARVAHAQAGHSAPVLHGSNPASVLVPSPRQRISILPPRYGLGDLAVGRDLISADPVLLKAYRRNPDLLPVRPEPAGIGDLRIGHDFILTTPEDAIPPSSGPEFRRHRLDAVFKESEAR